MKTVLLTSLILLLTVVARGEVGGQGVGPVLTKGGGANYYVLVNTATGTRELAKGGSYKATGVFFLPKVIKMEYEILDAGNSVRLWIPQPGNFSSDADSSDLQFPPGLNLQSVLDLGDQFELAVKPELKKVMAGFEPGTTILYRNTKDQMGVKKVLLADFDPTDFVASTMDCFSDQRDGYLTIKRTKPFTESEINLLFQAFEVRIHRVVTAISSVPVELKYPDPSLVFTDSRSSEMPFYKAFGLIDEEIGRLLTSDTSLMAFEQAVGPDGWRRDFLNQALDHYFASSCSTYQVRFRKLVKDESFKSKYFQTRVADLNLPFLPSKK